MSQVLELSIPRTMSTPARVALVPSHLPAPVRESLEHLQHAIGDKAGAEAAFASVDRTGKAAAQQAVSTSTAAVNDALSDFATLTAGSSTAIRDTAYARYGQAMETAAGALRGALDALVDANQAAALYASVTPGKPVLRLDTRAAEDAPVRTRLSMVRSDLRELLSQLPDDIDG